MVERTRPIGVVLSDCDGTEVRPHHKLPSSAVQATAHDLRAHGVPLLNITARSFAMHQKLVEPLALNDNLCALDGGATIARARSGEVLVSKAMGAETKNKIIRAIGPQCVRIGYDAVSRRLHAAEVVASLDHDADAAALGATAIFAICEERYGAGIVEMISAMPDVQATRLMNYDKDPTQRCVQIMSVGVEKGTASQELRALAHATHERALILGDGHNDIELFMAARDDDVTVAINKPDTPEELKDLATWVAPSVHDDGWAAAVQRFALSDTAWI